MAIAPSMGTSAISPGLFGTFHLRAKSISVDVRAIKKQIVKIKLLIFLFSFSLSLLFLSLSPKFKHRPNVLFDLKITLQLNLYDVASSSMQGQT